MSNIKISLSYEIIMIVAEKVGNWDIKVSLSNHHDDGMEKYALQAIISCIIVVLKFQSSDFISHVTKKNKHWQLLLIYHDNIKTG